jgi:hypothetical protein
VTVVTRWRDQVTKVVEEVLEDQPYFNTVTWEFAIDFRMVQPDQPAMAVGHIIIMVPSLLLGQPPLMAEVGLPIISQPPEDKLRESLKDFLGQIREAQRKQLEDKPTMTVNKFDLQGGLTR